MLELGKEKQAKCLEVKIGGEVYLIPGVRNIPVSDVKMLRALKEKKGKAREDASLDFFFEFFGRHLGDALDGLDMEDVNALMEAWNALSEEDGANLGE